MSNTLREILDNHAKAYTQYTDTHGDIIKDLDTVLVNIPELEAAIKAWIQDEIIGADELPDVLSKKGNVGYSRETYGRNNLRAEQRSKLMGEKI